MAEAEEQIKLAVLASKTNENYRIDLEKLYSNLKSIGDVGIKPDRAGDNTLSPLPWEVTYKGYTFIIDEEGKVTPKGAAIEVSSLTVKNGETELTANCKSVAEGTPLTINFTANIEGGTITSITPPLPYTPADADSVKLTEIFVIKGIDKDGNEVEKEYEVPLKGYYNIPELQVGDYITGYHPRTLTTEQINAIATDAINYSGDTTVPTLTQSATWRVLEVDETTGNPTKLISATTLGSLLLKGAKGYNNSVYLLNKLCRDLYSGSQSESVRSIAIEDLEAHYSETGKNAKTNYMVGTRKYGDKARYTDSYSNYPKIALEENLMGIDTETYTEETGTWNTIKTDGVNGSVQPKNEDNTEKTYTGTEDESKAKAETNGITVTQTYYNLSSISDLKTAYEKEAYWDLFHSGRNSYWLASRCVVADSGNSYCNFSVHGADSSNVGAGSLFPSYDYLHANVRGLCPVVNLKSNIQAEYKGAEGSTGYNTWELK